MDRIQLRNQLYRQASFLRALAERVDRTPDAYAIFDADVADAAEITETVQAAIDGRDTA